MRLKQKQELWSRLLNRASVEEPTGAIRSAALRPLSNTCALVAPTASVDVFIFNGGVAPGPNRILTIGHDNKTPRTLAASRGESEEELGETTEVVIAKSRVGGLGKLPLS